MKIEMLNLVYNDEGASGLVDGFLTMSIGGAILIVGTFIVSEINESIDACSATAQSELSELVERIYSGMQIGGTAILAVGAGLTIAALTGMRR